MKAVSKGPNPAARPSPSALLSNEAGWDVVVVGAGPGGAAAAIVLARRGRRVLIVDRVRFPRDKSCGDGITRAGVARLEALRVLPRLAEKQRVRGARVHMRNRGHRDFLYAGTENYGLVVPRIELDAAILDTAIAAGATFIGGCEARGLVRDDPSRNRITGVEVRDTGGNVHMLRCYSVIAADGASSRLAKEAGLRLVPASGYGTAVRAYLEGLPLGRDLLELRLPLTDMTDRYLLPSYGWMFPTGPTSANVGVGIFCREFDINVRALFDDFLETLRREDPAYRDAELTDSFLGAPLRFDFAPGQCAEPGLLLVGDAAGLISPFTGEGISFALESGELAADVVDRCLRLGTGSEVAAEDYRVLLGARFSGYFTLGNLASRRYELLWRVLDDTFQSDAPVHNLLRRLVLVPEGTGGTLEDAALDDVSALVSIPGMPLASDVAAVGAELNDIARADWPFLTRLSFAGRRTDLISFRPSLLLLLSAYLGQSAAADRRAAATALELAYLAFLAQSGVRDAVPGAERANWGDKFAVLLSDYLLAKSYEIGTRTSMSLVRRITDAMADACAARVEELRSAGRLDLPEEVRIDTMRRGTARLFRLPCEIGAELAGADDLTGALADYGEHLGLAYLLTEEDRALNAPPGSSVLASDFSAGIFSVPVLRAAAHRGYRPGDPGRLNPIEFREQLRAAGALAGCADLACHHRDEAHASLRALPPSPVRRALAALADYAVTRTIPERQSLRDWLDNG